MSMHNNTMNSVQITVCELKQVQTQLRGVDGGTQTMQPLNVSTGSSESGGSHSATKRDASDQLRGVTPETKAAVEQLLAAAEGNDADRVRLILKEQALVHLHKIAETGGLDVIIQQQGLTKLLHYGEQTGNIDLMKIVLDDPQQGQGCTGFVLACWKGQTKVLRLHLLKEGGEFMTTLGYLSQKIDADNFSSAGSQQKPADKPVVPLVAAESLEKKLKNYKNAINAMLVGAAVLVGVTFQFFLQSPDNPAFILIYCIYNSLSFYSAIATMITAAGAALPVSYSSIEEEVQTTRKWVRASSLLLAVSIIFVLGAVPGPNYGNRPNLTRNVALTTAKCVGLFLCAVAMTAYALRLNWKFIQNSDGDMLKQVIALLKPTKLLGKTSLRFWEFIGVVGLCVLISSLFLAFLFFLPFYVKLPTEWEPRAPAPAPAPAP